MTSKTCTLIGAPVQSGASQPGCVMGPDAYRTARLAETLRDLGHEVSDLGNVAHEPLQNVTHKNAAIHDLPQTVAWAVALEQAAFDAAQTSEMPIFLGGDHSLSIGTVPGVARHWQQHDRPLFVLWLDAHPDFHTLETTTSGNLHGTPVAYFSGLPGFEAYPKLAAPIDPANLCMLGIRSVDPAENAALDANSVDVSDMRAIDEHGIAAPLRAFLERVRAADGALHVSLDVDFLEPSIAPAVGTTVPGGATFREAHLVMEMLCDSGLVTSLDMVELNPFLDERGRTASLMVDLCASLMGRKVLDRQTRRF
ncbi:arginase [Litoreibacter albidus]|uniref:Arginase n=1 Tax=Litoreibacter albidus TaxID=670155 RepID=A0A1H2VME4_9RHOB|nr:arginase [Litoreibacter albidus]SDW69457.1 arginase [Litoreibacter albidus]